MDPSTAQHQRFGQAMTTQSLEDMMGSTKAEQEKKLLTRPQPEQLKCPRCDSSNTKFCYYNNYSLTQPRYFCKACRRYWTKGGSLRNVPVGGGCRKNKRSSSSSSSSSSRRSQQQDQVFNNSNPLSSFPMLPSLSYDSNDLTLAFGGLNKQPTRQLRVDDHDTSILGNLNSLTNNNHNPAFLDVLRNAGFLENPNGFHHNFYYGYGNGNMGGGGVEQNGSGSEEMVLPFEDMSGGSTTAATVMTTAKQETYNGRDGENRLFFNFPWQYGEGNMGNVDSGRESWNGLGSSWHGLVNSSLM